MLTAVPEPAARRAGFVRGACPAGVRVSADGRDGYRLRNSIQKLSFTAACASLEQIFNLASVAARFGKRGNEMENRQGLSTDSIRLALQSLKRLRKQFEERAKVPCEVVLVQHPKGLTNREPGYTPIAIFEAKQRFPTQTTICPPFTATGDRNQQWEQMEELPLLYVFGEPDSIRQFLELSDLAGKVLEGLVLTLGEGFFRWSRISGRGDNDCRWLAGLFDLACQSVAGSPLSADNGTWVPSSLKGWADATSCAIEGGLVWENGIDHPATPRWPRNTTAVQKAEADRAGCWWSRIDNASLASAHAIDLIRERLKRVQESHDATERVKDGGPSEEKPSRKGEGPIAQAGKPVGKPQELAFKAATLAANVAERELTDAEAHERLENDTATIEAIENDRDLEGYEVPDLRTFRRYLSTARKAYGSPRKLPTGGRAGRSMVKRDGSPSDQ